MKTTTIRNILVPIDFSKMSIHAIETAKTFAQSFGASVHLAHVHQFSYPAGFTAAMPPIVPYSTYTYDEDAEKRTVTELNLLVKKYALAAAHLLTGSAPFDEICRLAKDLPADLILMPTHGWSGLKHVFLGSTAEHTVQHSPCPVFVVRGRQPKSDLHLALKTILVPTDFSSCSLRGIKYAIAFAQTIQAKLVLLHVVPYRYTTNGWVTYELTEVTRVAEKEAEQQMRNLVDAVKFGGVQFKTTITTGNAVDKICDYARERDVDLIITSTHGRSGWKHVLMGSVAENVVRRAPCSVMAVPSFRRTRHAMSVKQSATKPANPEYPADLVATEKLTRKYRKLTAHKFPERRETNRFRETHLVS